MSILLTLISLAALTYAHLAFWTWRYRRLNPPDERHFIRAADGWRLALNRIRPAGEAAGGAPVLLCPGLACNSRFFDAADSSLARHLAALGFDVWMLDPRGTGHSERAGLSPKRWRYGFEEYAALDAPAAVAHVVARTGHKPFWVGHSMGGLIGYRAAISEGLPGVAAIGSPVVAPPQRLSVGRVGAWLLRALPPVVVPIGTFGRMALPIAGRLRLWPERLFIKPENLSGLGTRRFLAEVAEDTPTQLLAQFADNIHEVNSALGHPLRESLAALAEYEGPVLTIAGGVDCIAPPDAVDGPTPKAARTHAEVDAGHLDIVQGPFAAREVFPQVSDWLLARLPAASNSRA